MYVLFKCEKGRDARLSEMCSLSLTQTVSVIDVFKLLNYQCILGQVVSGIFRLGTSLLELFIFVASAENLVSLHSFNLPTVSLYLGL